MALALAIIALQLTLAPPAVSVTGTIRDETGLPLAGATVDAAGRLLGVSDDQGLVALTLPAGVLSRLSVSLPGFLPRTIEVQPDRSSAFEAVLVVAGMSEVVRVQAPPRPATTTAAHELAPLQVYRTPGAQGDVLRALQALPGVASDGDGAGFFVRGGDVGETLVSLEDGVMAHPYRNESPAGGFRGAVDPLQIAGLSFVSGGFGARYGNALSGVVDLRGADPPSARELTATAGLAGVSLAIGAPVGRRGGVRGTFTRTATALLFAVSGQAGRFSPPPEGWDASATAVVSLGRVGRLQGFALSQRDEVGVAVEQEAFVGRLRAASRHHFATLGWDRALGGWTANATLGVDVYRQSSAVGVRAIATDDRVVSWRAEAIRPTAAGVMWRVGVNGAASRAAQGGTVPQRAGDFAGVSGQRPFDVRRDDAVSGGYADMTLRHGWVVLEPGLRVDRYGLAGTITMDPRLNIRVAVPRLGALRAATGVYHQAPSAAYFDRVAGATTLAPMRAVHVVLGYEAGRDSGGAFLRVEGYRKRYDRLPLEHRERGVLDDGYGHATGVDVFAQWLSSHLELRGSASWSEARRRWTPVDERLRFALPEGTWPPDFATPWTVQVIASVPLGAGRTAGASWRSQAGRPWTPVVAATPIAGGYVPEFGAINSERLPRYERLDVTVSWLRPLGEGVVVTFASLDNVLGRVNPRGYVYSPDYATRRLVGGLAPRSLYVGLSYRR